MHLPQTREPAGPVAAEVLVQADVGVDAQELPDALDGQDLAVGQGWPGTTLAKVLAGQPVVDQAEHGDDEGRKLHGGPSCGAVMASPAAYEGLCIPPRKPPHRVSYMKRPNGGWVRELRAGLSRWLNRVRADESDRHRSRRSMAKLSPIDQRHPSIAWSPPAC